MLVSINDRGGRTNELLEALLDVLTTNKTTKKEVGQNIGPLDDQWIYDLVALQKHEADEMERMKEEEENQRTEARYEQLTSARHPSYE